MGPWDYTAMGIGADGIVESEAWLVVCDDALERTYHKHNDANGNTIAAAITETLA